MTPTAYALRRIADHGLTIGDVKGALESEIRRETQVDGRERVYGWCERIGKCLRVILEDDGDTLVNAMPDRKCTKGGPP